jgi:hypothetical protein
MPDQQAFGSLKFNKVMLDERSDSLSLTCKRFDKPVEVSVEGLAHYANMHNQQTGRLPIQQSFEMTACCVLSQIRQ